MNTVLVVEDNKTLRCLYGKFLRSLGFRVQDAGNIQETLDCLSHTVPQIVLLDMALPDGDSAYILNYMSQHLEYANTEKIVISNDPDWGTNVILEGVRGYLHKPVSTNELVITLNQLVA